MVGWDHHSGHAHPVFDGVIVCEEFAETLRAAAEEDEQIQRQREIEKKEKRVYGNWKLLIRGLLIKQKMKLKYLQDTSSPPSHEEEKKKGKKKAAKLDADAPSWPLNRMDEEPVAKKKKARSSDDKCEDMTNEAETISLEKIQRKRMEIKLTATKKKHVPVAGDIFGGTRDIVENLNLSEDSEDDDNDDGANQEAKASNDIARLKKAASTKSVNQRKSMPKKKGLFKYQMTPFS